jgi:HEAT repeat protein
VRLPREVRRSCAQAIGLGAEHLSAQIFESLSTVAERESDAPLRAFAVMALGEIAARGGFDATLAGRSRKRLLDAVEHFYVSAIRGSKRAAVDRPWYLISAGLFAGQFEESRPAIAAQLLRAVNKERAKEARAAAVVALSLTKDASASTALLGRLDKAKEIESRARIVEALGVLGAQETTDQLLSILRKDGPERLRYHAAIGLGFLADAELLAEFHGRIANSDSDPERAVVARVVGELGDRASIDPLLELAGGEKLDVELRRHALWGLGTLGRHAEPNWRFPFGRGLNFLAASPAMQMLLEMR